MGMTTSSLGQTRRPNGDDSGESYVVFGKGAGYSASLDLSSLTEPMGSSSMALMRMIKWYSVSSAGDINNDGFDDIIIGANLMMPCRWFYNKFARKTTTQHLGLSSLTETPGSSSTVLMRMIEVVFRVPAGDINNDGYDDIIIGATEQATTPVIPCRVWQGKRFLSISGLVCLRRKQWVRHQWH